MRRFVGLSTGYRVGAGAESLTGLDRMLHWQLRPNESDTRILMDEWDCDRQHVMSVSRGVQDKPPIVINIG